MGRPELRAFLSPGRRSEHDRVIDAIHQRTRSDFRSRGWVFTCDGQKFGFLLRDITRKATLLHSPSFLFNFRTDSSSPHAFASNLPHQQMRALRLACENTKSIINFDANKNIGEQMIINSWKDAAAFIFSNFLSLWNQKAIPEVTQPWFRAPFLSSPLGKVTRAGKSQTGSFSRPAPVFSREGETTKH